MKQWSCGVCHPPPFPDGEFEEWDRKLNPVKVRVVWLRDMPDWEPEPAKEVRDRAIRQVGENAPPDWMAKAYQAVRYIASKREQFTTDAVWYLVGEPPEPRALGAVMVKVKAKRVAVPTDRTVESKRPECHARPLRVWRSLTYGMEIEHP